MSMSKTVAPCVEEFESEAPAAEEMLGRMQQRTVQFSDVT